MRCELEASHTTDLQLVNAPKVCNSHCLPKVRVRYATHLHVFFVAFLVRQSAYCHICRKSRRMSAWSRR